MHGSEAEHSARQPEHGWHDHEQRDPEGDGGPPVPQAGSERLISHARSSILLSRPGDELKLRVELVEKDVRQMLSIFSR
jgi:hypothetical protein